MDMHTKYALILSLAVAAAHAAVPPPRDAAVATLLERARLWDDRNRPQLARETLEKLFRFAPDHPDGLAALAGIEARAERPVMARAALDKLRRIQPGHPAIPGIELQLRLAGPDRHRLEQTRQLARQSRLDGRRDQRPKALAAYRALFGDAVPDGDLALEYWQLVAEDWDDWTAAHDGLAELARRHPDNLRYRYALAEHETTRLPINERALQILIDMTQLPEFERQARAAWRRVMLRLDPAPEHVVLLEAYLQREPNDSVVQGRLKTLAAAVASGARPPAAADAAPRSAGLALLDKGKLEAAELQIERESRQRPDDAELIGGMGLLRLRQGHHAQAQAYFERARRLQPAQAAKWSSLAATARFWGLLREAADARGGREFALAEDKLRAALALDDREPQAWVALARVQDEQRHPAAEASYRRALALDPVNRAALAGLLDLLVRDGRHAAARLAMADLDQAQRAALGRDLGLLQAGLLRAEADARLAAGAADAAIALLEEAIRLDGDDPWLRYSLGRIFLARQETTRGLALFDELLARRPGDSGALYAKALLQSGADQEMQALTTLEQIAAEFRDGKLTRFQRELWTGLQLERASAALRENRPEPARRLLEAAELALGADVEQLPRIARGWAAAGDIARARTLFDQLRRKSPDLPADALLTEADILAAAGLADEVRTVLQRLPAGLPAAQAERALQARERAVLQAAQALAEGGRIEAAHELLAAEPGERSAVLRALAALETRLGRPAEAVATYRRRLALEPAQAEARAELADALIAAGAAAEAIEEIDRWLGVAAADGRLADDGLRLSPRLMAGSDALMQARIRALRATGNLAAADRSLRRVLAVYPDATPTRTELIRLLDAAGRAEQATAEFDIELAAVAQGDPLEKIPLAEFLAERGHLAEARRLLAALLARLPDNSRLLLLSARVAQAAGQHEDAIAMQQRGFALEQAENLRRTGSRLSSLTPRGPATDGRVDVEIAGPAASPPADAAQEVAGHYGLQQLAALIDTRAGWFAAGIDRRERIGTPGLSQYLSDEVAAETVLPLANGDRWFVRADAARLRAGRLDMGNAEDVRLFGSMALCADAPAGCRAAPAQAVEGLGLAVGWLRQDRRIDLGLTPTNFAVSNWIGGIADKGELGPFSWSADLSRRALASSLLSWAGTRDPNSGRIWGGVVATGLRLGLSHDQGGAFGFWSSLGLHALTGKNVQSNQRMQLMAGGYWRLVNRSNQLFSVGLTGMNWRFDRNVGEYSFGHGGYYSPAAYQSLAIPLTWAQRFVRSAYVLRVATSVSRARTDSAPYFPEDPAMQAAAIARGIDATYAATPGNAPSSRGWSLHLGWEYQLDPSVFLGGRIEIERSPDYAPDRYLLYLRYNLDRAAAQPVPLQPAPFLPYSQF